MGKWGRRKGKPKAVTQPLNEAQTLQAIAPTKETSHLVTMLKAFGGASLPLIGLLVAMQQKVPAVLAAGFGVGCGLGAMVIETKESWKNWKNAKLLIGGGAVVLTLATIYGCWYVSLPPTVAYLVPKSGRSHGTTEPHLVMGGISAVLTEDQSTTIVRHGDDSVIELLPTKNGALISGKFFDGKGNLVAIIEKNRITTNTHSIFSVKHEKGEFTVRNWQGDVLSIEHPDPNTFTLKGIIGLKTGRQVRIEEDKLIGPNGTTFSSISIHPRKRPVVIQVGRSSSELSSLFAIAE